MQEYVSKKVLKCTYVDGMKEDGTSTYRSKSYQHIHFDATADALTTVADALFTLSEKALFRSETVTTAILQ